MAHPECLASQPLPDDELHQLVETLHEAHGKKPFEVADPRKNVLRAYFIAREDLGLELARHIGEVDFYGGVLKGHHWLTDGKHVIDVSFPMLNRDFVGVLRGYVVGQYTREELAHAGAAYDFRERILGTFPDKTLRYLGEVPFHDKDGLTARRADGIYSGG